MSEFYTNQTKEKESIFHRIKTRIANTKINLDFFIHCLCFISVLLIGADRWGITLFGVNFRLDQIFLCILTFLLIAKNALRFTFDVWIMGFAVCSLISSVFAVNFARGIIYYCSIIYNIVFIFYALSSYVRAYGITKFLNIFRATCYVQFAVILIQFILKVVFQFELSFLPSYDYYFGIPRFQIWFYEPSYLATYLIFWFALSCYMFLIAKRNGYIFDILFALIMFVISTSTSGFIGIALVVAAVYLMWLIRGVSAKKIMVAAGIIILLIVFRFAFSSIYDVFIARLFHSSLDDASGGRITGWTESWQVFLENPFFGVGPGNYGLYLNQDAGYVPTNVTFDLLATLGIFGFLTFYGLTVSLIVQCIKLYRKKFAPEAAVLVALAFALIIFTVILQFNQGYLRLYHWMFFGVLDGAVKSYNLQLHPVFIKKSTDSVLWGIE